MFAGRVNELGNALVGYAKQIPSVSERNTNLDQLRSCSRSCSDRCCLRNSKSAA